MSVEITALQRSLEAILEHRAALRKDYVDRDREIGMEIKAILNRIRELEDNASPRPEIENQAPQYERSFRMEAHQHPARKKRARYDYQTDVVPVVLELLKENGKMKSAEIMRALHERHNLIFSNPTIAMNKIMAEEPSIQKIDGYYTFQQVALTN